jgi:hypothetical protein
VIIHRSQIKLFIDSIGYLIEGEENRLRSLEEVQGGCVAELNRRGRAAKTEQEQNELWTVADKEEAELDEKQRDWIYRRFFLRRFLDHLRKELRKPNDGGSHAAAA